VTATSEVRFDQNGAAKVQSYVRLTASTYIRCCTYEDAAPILTIQDGPADITITNPGSGKVTEDDVQFGRLLAEVVGPVPVRTGEVRQQGPHHGGRPGPCRAGGVMNATKAGRLELVPPAAPGFSPVCTKEVTRLCARS
jgi:hypothetical protein